VFRWSQVQTRTANIEGKVIDNYNLISSFVGGVIGAETPETN
jgi:hypothetical protein